jgi:hypothetical protein
MGSSHEVVLVRRRIMPTARACHSRADDHHSTRLLFSNLMGIVGHTNQPVRCEVLKGLPGEGPAPKHFHGGHPTPWTEGVVVRVRNADGGEWVGNFQGGHFSPKEIVAWPEANSVVVIVGGCFYLVDTDNPDNYLTLGPGCDASAAILSADRTRLFVAEWYQVIAYGRDRRPIWESDTLFGFILSIGESHGVLELEVELVYRFIKT